MSDSLRDQLLKAGFKADKPVKKNRHKNSAKQAGKSGAGHHVKHQQRASAAETASRQAEIAAADVAAKKALKEQIKTLIETHSVKNHAGTVAFNYQVGSRLKQLFVSEACQKQLANEELVITRLNGSTFLVPPEIGQEIVALNPQWALHVPGAGGSDGDNTETDYAEHQIPDDLIW